jgi:hypothetical protein
MKIIRIKRTAYQRTEVTKCFTHSLHTADYTGLCDLRCHIIQCNRMHEGITEVYESWSGRFIRRAVSEISRQDLQIAFSLFTRCQECLKSWRMSFPTPALTFGNRIKPLYITILFCGEGPRSRCHGRTAALRLIVPPCDEDWFFRFSD